MRTVLRNTGWRRTFAAALTVAVAGAVAIPLATASSASTSHPRSGETSIGSDSRAESVDASTGVTEVGAAVKYVREADGTVRQVR